ncbi:MAG: NADH-quinone oxidoreductase subunit A [Pirellulaceae bacterium]|nr:NADH-quinone oxidoreductase subunit A [Pirellulaceae bacterium]
MSSALESSLGIVAYLALFAAVGVTFLFVNLLVGWFLRPSNPNEDKLEIYECGEPAIGSSFVQFDLRFYVVALLFIIFDVEVAFFFPWATVFGKANDLHDMAENGKIAVVQQLDDSSYALSDDARYLYRELGIPKAQLPLHGATSDSEVMARVPASLRQYVAVGNSLEKNNTLIMQHGSKQLAWVTTIDIAVFFVVLLVGFAYVWKRGDLDWVRAINDNHPDP